MNRRPPEPYLFIHDLGVKKAERRTQAQTGSRLARPSF